MLFSGNQSSVQSFAGCLGLLACAGIASAQFRSPASPFDEAETSQGLVSISDKPIVVTATAGLGPQAAADHLISYQCASGGWGWPHEACPTTTYNNLSGPIALGLLRIWEITGDAATLAAATDAGDYDLTYMYGGGEARFSTYTPAFLHTLSAANGDSTYSDHVATEFFDELTAVTYGDSDLDTYTWIDAVETARSGSYINLRPWEFSTLPSIASAIGNGDSTTPADAVPQSDAFEDAVLGGLDTLEEGLTWDLLGLAGGIRGLALNGATSFAPIVAPLFDDIDALTDLCDLADVLVSFQNTDGSWSWRSDLQNPGDETDKDTQTTAYAVLALIAADDAGCTPLPGGRYISEIAAGRGWLDSMQDGTGGFAAYPTGDHNIEAEAEAAHAATIETLTLSTSSPCENSGTVTVSIDMDDMPDLIVGGQFFLEYDNAVLDFVSADPGGAPFTIEVFELVDEGSGTIGYAVGVPGGGPGTASATTMATLTFATLAEVCSPTADLVTFDVTADPPTRLTNDVGDEFLATLVNLGEITIDETDPMITDPADIMVNADAGVCTADVTVPALVVSDACTGVDTVINDYNGTSDASDTYPTGTTVVTWTVTDNCGNVAMEDQEITVDGVNDLVVDVELRGVGASFTRCITFELFETGCGGSVIVEDDVDFVAGFADDWTLEVPCGEYDCITARDKLHTLRRTDDDGDFMDTGTEYVADFTASGTTVDDLIGGNLNDDEVIDILDFGIFVGQFGLTLGADTLCGTAAPHSDLSGDGDVFAADFTFITTNFLTFREDDCCIALLAGGWGNYEMMTGPVTRISVRELRRRGMRDLVIADLNHDGWLDVADVVAFLGGARP